MIHGVIEAIKAVFRSFSAIVKYKLWGHVLFSGMISIAVASVTFYAIWNQSDRLGDWLSGLYPWEKGSGIISSFADWLVWIVLMIVALFLYKYIMLVLSAPILSAMSDKIERINTGKSNPKFSLSSTIKSTVRGLRLALSNLSRELILTLILLIISLFPGAALFTTPLIFIIQAYYAGFGSMDFYMERHFNVKESRNFVKRNRGIAIGNGMIFIGLLAVPILGFFIGPTITAIAASLNVHEKIHHQRI